ncbi:MULTISPECIES: LysR substrate-binding domain-containing protein [Rhizobium]|uniref:LysR substrate-binding domain-containing protein n=1 Tax=Rhizobium rhododendri TaxID=2506430 RepID=A0ABY8IE20_9HYPH|nr:MULTISPECIES: LysR substrate-binding domain-containing protein [Rhizobium]MBZ5759055.1 LysR family transcriptional regulator [Rhizobium sp. VS19-DR96]MBZ5764115.1 LysR family transcriptional regulator [Rhizobium sp. VS19-DR129.2]MBZ5771658.1 LysR family transcriptional regulator [Rhizobium sp. VS19-DRK62.2]MBZ5783655.1 LysR family transcriptional regulator [Rhizobium sp. VS19-DR121]MBZ5801671.1 LysR family transcriptional regulator [Rhizobium sp. VS19-DR181]
MSYPVFDLDILRSFVAGIELGTFAKAAERVGRSTSAVSAQIKKLEEQAGRPIFRKAGRGLALTEAGETLLAYAHRLLDLNDEAVTAVQGMELEGWVRLGLQEDFGEALLPEVLGRFARAHPKVRIEARVVRNVELMERVRSGRLDLALAWSNGERTAHCELVGEVPMCWVGPMDGRIDWMADSGEPMPLATLEAPCLLRTAATKAMDSVGLGWRVAFVSPSLGGLWAATAAGLGITVRTPLGLPGTVRPLFDGELGLPSLPKLDLVLHRAAADQSPATQRLAAIILEALRPSLAAFRHG